MALPSNSRNEMGRFVFSDWLHYLGIYVIFFQTSFLLHAKNKNKYYEREEESINKYYVFVHSNHDGLPIKTSNKPINRFNALLKIYDVEYIYSNVKLL